jgi:hypothetical protein
MSQESTDLNQDILLNPYNLIVHIAEQYLGIEELDGNRGEMIDHWNRLSGVPLGSPWCASFAMFCVNGTSEQLSIESPLYKSAHVLSVYNQSRACWAPNPEKGFLVCWQMSDTTSGHIGIITEVMDRHTIKTIEGNTTSEKSVNREGRFVAANTRNLGAVGKLKLKGFLDPWRSWRYAA